MRNFAPCENFPLYGIYINVTARRAARRSGVAGQRDGIEVVGIT